VASNATTISAAVFCRPHEHEAV